MFCILIFAFALVFQMLLSREANVSKTVKVVCKSTVNIRFQ